MKKAMLMAMAMFISGCSIFPPYREWSKKWDGKAKLAEAKYSRQVIIEQAEAERQAAEALAAAIRTVGEAAKKYPEYRNQMFIQSFGEALKEGKIKQIIYVPTEGNIPILEATRMQKQ